MWKYKGVSVIRIALFFIIGFSVVSFSDIANPGASDLQIEDAWPILAGLIIAFTPIIRAHARVDANIILAGIKIGRTDHAIRLFLRLLVGAIVAYAIHKPALQILSLLFFMMSYFWIFFDAMLNTYRGKEMFYISTAYKAAFFDKLLSKFKSLTVDQMYSITYLTVKVIVIILSVYLYAKMF